MTATASEAPAQPAVASSDAATRAGLVVVARRFGIVALLVLLDLWAKSMVFHWLGDVETSGESVCHEYHRDHRVPLIGDWFAFMRSTNRGAAFGKLSEWPHLLIGGRALAAVFLSYLLLKNPTSRKLFSTAMILILAGALGNLYDNLWLDPPGLAEGGTGYAAGLMGNLYNVLFVTDLPSGHPYGEVRDFIDVYFPVWDWHFPTFNVADSCITVGAVLLLISGFFGDEARSGDERADAA